MSTFDERLLSQRSVGDKHSRQIFEGVVVKIDPYNKRATVDKAHEVHSVNYSFSQDQIRAYDFLEALDIPVTVKTEEGKCYPWKELRARMPSNTRSYEVLSI